MLTIRWTTDGWKEGITLYAIPHSSLERWQENIEERRRACAEPNMMTTHFPPPFTNPSLYHWLTLQHHRFGRFGHCYSEIVTIGAPGRVHRNSDVKIRCLCGIIQERSNYGLKHAEMTYYLRFQELNECVIDRP